MPHTQKPKLFKAWDRKNPLMMERALPAYEKAQRELAEYIKTYVEPKRRRRKSTKQ